MIRKLWVVGVLAIITLFVAAFSGKKAQAKPAKELFEIQSRMLLLGPKGSIMPIHADSNGTGFSKLLNWRK
jgi:hypothetical protein